MEGFEEIKGMYVEALRCHGDSPASLLTPKGRSHLRFRAIKEQVNKNGLKILDYGCGLGYLYDYLSKTKFSFEYTGIDMVPQFIDSCKLKYPKACFDLIDPTRPICGEYDIVFASGVFNLMTHDSEIISKEYALERIEYLFSITNEILVCDFLSSLVDFKQSKAQHFSPSEIVEFCSNKLSRRFKLRHDLLPYEMTLIVWKNDEIHRPDNIYSADK
ncbi:class I SAM-dependent methyltransferase [Opitutales bacterium]|nr:class I SAM-dependent methyltransferase [Opitutales bacterium]